MIYNFVLLTGNTSNLHYEAEPVKHIYSGKCEKNISSACEKKISLVVKEKLYTDDIVFLWVKMATLSGNVHNNKQ
jgi:hypothetical protein